MTAAHAERLERELARLVRLRRPGVRLVAVERSRHLAPSSWAVEDLEVRLSDGSVVQLVLQTGATVEGWRSQLLQTYTRSVDTGIDAWNEPATSSIAAFGPKRGLVVHGVRDPAQAIAVLRLALPRL